MYVSGVILSRASFLFFFFFLFYFFFEIFRAGSLLGLFISPPIFPKYDHESRRTSIVSSYFLPKLSTSISRLPFNNCTCSYKPSLRRHRALTWGHNSLFGFCRSFPTINAILLAVVSARIYRWSGGTTAAKNGTNQRGSLLCAG